MPLETLDTAVLAYISVSPLRQQILPTHRILGIFERMEHSTAVIYNPIKRLLQSGGELDVLVIF